VGSTSALEPFHSNSTFMYTPAVFAQMLDEHGLVPRVVSAGIDGLTLLTRRMVRQFGGADEAQAFGRFFAADSPLSRVIDACGAAQGVDRVRVNSLKLELCGQFHFLAEKV
jgi:hypothetical protein